MSEPSPPRDATTVILLRHNDGDEMQLFMVKRHGKSAFMANAYVYPGGRLDDADQADELSVHVTGRTAEHCVEALQEDISAELARGLFLAGIREAFEEAGVLLAHAMDDDARSALGLGEYVDTHFSDWRERLNEREVGLLELARAEKLAFPLDRLLPFAHWITPEVEPKRYDTRFLVGICPEDQELAHDDIETVDSAWLSPAEALDRYAQGQLQLAPPTFRTLEQLADLGTIDAVEDYCGQVTIPTIMPQFKSIDDNLVLLLPGDPDFDAANADTDVGAVDGSTRIVLSEGRWWSR